MDPGDDYFALPNSEERELPSSWDTLQNERNDYYGALRPQLPSWIYGQFYADLFASEEAASYNGVEYGYYVALTKEEDTISDAIFHWDRLEALFNSWDNAQIIQTFIDILWDYVEWYDLYPTSYNYEDWLLQAYWLQDVSSLWLVYSLYLCNLWTNEHLRTCLSNIYNLFLFSQKLKKDGTASTGLIWLVFEHRIITIINYFVISHHPTANLAIKTIASVPYVSLDEFMINVHTMEYQLLKDIIINDDRSMFFGLLSQYHFPKWFVNLALHNDWFYKFFFDEKETLEYLRKKYYEAMTNYKNDTSNDISPYTNNKFELYSRKNPIWRMFVADWVLYRFPNKKITRYFQSYYDLIASEETNDL